MKKTHYRAIHIDATNRTIKEVQIEIKKSLEGLQKCVGGYIETASRLRSGDMLFVNEEGELCNPQEFFALIGAHKVFAGSGVIVCQEEYEDAISSLDTITKSVKFFSKSELLKITG